MSCIDIEIFTDPSLLLKNYPDHSNDHLSPTAIKQDEAFMVAVPARNVLKGLATDVLELTAKKGDDMRWRITSAVKTDYYAIIYKIELCVSTDATTCPAITAHRRSCHIPDPEHPTQYTDSQYIDTYWHCKVKKTCEQIYKLCFYIVRQDDTTGVLNTVGYYSWQATLILQPDS